MLEWNVGKDLDGQPINIVLSKLASAIALLDINGLHQVTANIASALPQRTKAGQGKRFLTTEQKEDRRKQQLLKRRRAYTNRITFPHICSYVFTCIAGEHGGESWSAKMKKQVDQLTEDKRQFLQDASQLFRSDMPDYHAVMEAMQTAVDSTAIRAVGLSEGPGESSLDGERRSSVHQHTRASIDAYKARLGEMLDVSGLGSVMLEKMADKMSFPGVSILTKSSKQDMLKIITENFFSM